MTESKTDQFEGIFEDISNDDRRWDHPEAGPSSRRLSPWAIDQIFQRLSLGMTKAQIARELGVSKPTVAKVAAKRNDDTEWAAMMLAELADAERELRAPGSSPANEMLIQMVRRGHLVRRELELRKDL